MNISFVESFHIPCAVSCESAPSQSFGCAQPERSQTVGYPNSRLFEGSLELTIAVS